MAAVRLPDPQLPMPIDLVALERSLRGRVNGEVRFDEGSPAAYSTDSSNYRQVPLCVVIPRDIDAVVETIRVCFECNAPVLSRGAGTSLAGETCNNGVVIDWSKYCHRIESIDSETRTAVVEPGVVLDELNRAAAEFGLMFGPRPATHAHCTIGGMIGNNSCGSSAQAFGKTADNVVRLELLCYDGTRLWVGGESDRGGLRAIAAQPSTAPRVKEILVGLAGIADEFGDDIRDGFPNIPRRVSGYSLDDLLPENGPDLARMVTGSESTLVTVLRAEVRLVPIVPAIVTVLLGFPDIASAADAVPHILSYEPLILEGMDGGMIDSERRRGVHSRGLELLPEGDSWLLVQFGGKNSSEARRRADKLADYLGAQEDSPPMRILDNADDESTIMAVREGGLAATARLEGGVMAWPGWEDAAVDPARLGDYLRDFRTLLNEFGYDAACIYGHFGHGCVHTRIPFDLTTLHGVRDFRAFVDRAARLVVEYGGSLSGEHGDGQARGALLPIMYGERVMEAFQRTKDLFDPRGKMNPGKVISADDPAANLRLGAGYTPRPVPQQWFAYPDDKGSFAAASLRCVGVGACRDHDSGVMCPSYRASGEEEHSTRGRARLLAEMMRGEDSAITDGWRSTEVLGALDLCLSCKGCKSDCPVGVDMATYKAEFLAHHYEHRLRPMSHYTMGWLPLWSRLVSVAPRLVNALTHAPALSRMVAKLGGLDRDRPLPVFARRRFSSSFRRRPPADAGVRGDVLLWPDTFTNSFHPGVARAAVEVLEDAGYRVRIPESALCCGLTWISTGQLSVARRVLRRTARELAPILRTGVPLVGLEPSCTAVFRSDGPELLPGDDDVALLAESTVTLSELLDRTQGWRPPAINRRALVQPHCHQHAVLGFDADRRVLESAGVELDIVDGCCGLAGNFGFEAGHLDVSMAVAETELLPAVRKALDDTVVLADGFSCRTQLEQSGQGRQAVHLAELLAAGIRGDLPAVRVEEHITERPGPPQTLRRRVDAVPFVVESRSQPPSASASASASQQSTR
jgi:FAD/FMN-containing dehydrogenase/Fe-S oxidoreductase